MEIKVKSLDPVPEKSVQEVEENLLQKHEEEKSPSAERIAPGCGK